MGEVNDTPLIMEQISATPGLEITNEEQNTKIGTTSMPLLDQHISLLKELSLIHI